MIGPSKSTVSTVPLFPSVNTVDLFFSVGLELKKLKGKLRKNVQEVFITIIYFDYILKVLFLAKQ